MFKKDFDLSTMPVEIQDAIARKPIVLGSKSIGEHFRNQEEVDDVGDVVSRMQGVAIQAGLCGSRLEGHFTWEIERLTAILGIQYGIESVLKDTETGEESRFLDFEERVRRAAPRVAPLAEWLQEEASRVNNLEDIDLRTLPAALLPLIQVSPLDMYVYMLPPDVKKERFNGKYQDDDRVLPRPGALFPDIDVAAICPTEELVQLVPMPTIGERSGVRVHTTAVVPGYFNEGHSHGAITNLLSKFRPFTE